MTIQFERVDGAGPWLTPSLERVAGYAAFARQYAGARTEGGLYRVHDDRSGAIATEAVPIAFPDFAGRLDLFGQDWLGRQFGFDHDREVDGGPGVLLFELATGSVLDLPFSLTTFHEAYDDIREPAFSVGLFEQWRAAYPASLPLASTACIGYRQPLFLDGDESVDNLEESDLDVYLTLTAQIWDQVRDLPEGATVDGFGTG